MLKPLSTALIAASLAACGGGGDDAPAPQALLSDCAAPTTMVTGVSRYAATLQVPFRSGNTPLQGVGTREDHDTFAEPADFNGQRVLRNRTITTYTFTAPSALANAALSQVVDSYYVFNPDGNKTVYATATAQKWSDQDPVGIYVEAYDPPYVALGQSAVPPGASSRISTTAVWQSDDNGETTNGTRPYNVTQTYAGQEQVTVPGGTFTTCRMENEGADAQQTFWAIKGPQGIFVKLQSAGESAQLISFSGYQ